MIYRISLGYGVNDVVKAMDRETYARFREKVADFVHFDEWKEDKPEPPSFWSYNNSLYAVEEDLLSLTRHGISYEVKSFKNGYWRGDQPTQGNMGGTHIHITVPNIGLLMIDEVTWEEDACTQQLQSRLDDGWRILAVCPPNGDRRPTYILGRKKTDA
jgi:hypothetical protein